MVLKENDELKRGNEKLRRLLEESLYDDQKPNQNTLSQRRYQKEIQSLNTRRWVEQERERRQT